MLTMILDRNDQRNYLKKESKRTLKINVSKQKCYTIKIKLKQSYVAGNIKKNQYK
jgi:hypothetical protein